MTAATTGTAPCSYHPERPSTFRCEGCRRAFCDECAAADIRGRCLNCGMIAMVGEAAQDRPAIESVSLPSASRRRGGATTLVATLVALNVVAGVAAWRIAAPPAAPAEIERAFAAADELKRVADRNRDTRGRVAAGVDALVGRLSPTVAEALRSGRLSYRPSADRLSFRVESRPR